MIENTNYIFPLNTFLVKQLMSNYVSQAGNVQTYIYWSQEVSLSPWDQKWSHMRSESEMSMRNSFPPDALSIY